MGSIPKILIVDDKETNLIALEKLLEGFNIEILKALSGTEALKLTLKNDFALALIDVQMPEMDGYETLQYLRASKSTRYLPVIFVSAIFSDEFYIVKGIETGAVDFISKPINAQILTGKVRVFLELYEQRQKLELEIISRKRAEKDLEEAKKSAEAANKSKSMFLATMSHEIRTPLNGVIGMTDIIAQTNLTEQQKEYLNIIRLSGQNLLSIINDILDFSKIESGQVVLEKIPVKIAELAEEMKMVFMFRAREKKIELLSEIGESVPDTIIGDPVRLKQIVINFIGNALKFTDRGNITVRISCISDINNEVELKFEVIDTGIGISEEGKKNLFIAFSQSDISTFRKFGGTGLGLSISKNLVNIMNGKIGVESKEDEGSNFWFSAKFIKSSDGEKSDKEETTVKKKLEKIDITILLAEDNPINQKVVIYNLKDLGYEIDVAANGKEAVDYYKKSGYKLILMDIQMPVMDGLEATKHIREYELSVDGDKKAYIVAITANVLKEDIEKYYLHGIDDYISKPFQKEDLKRVINKTLTL